MKSSDSINAFVGPGQDFSLIIFKTSNEPLGILGTKVSSAILVGLYKRKSRYKRKVYANDWECPRQSRKYDSCKHN